MRILRDGRSIAVAVEMRGDTLIRGFPSGPRRVRSSTTVQGASYHEIGEFTRPGVPPIKTIEMTWRRE